jgi:hypothetical protein
MYKYRTGSAKNRRPSTTSTTRVTATVPGTVAASELAASALVQHQVQSRMK